MYPPTGRWPVQDIETVVSSAVYYLDPQEISITERLASAVNANRRQQ